MFFSFFKKIINPKETNQQLASNQIFTIKVPDFGVGSSFILSKWLVKTGDVVKTGDILCEIENDNFHFEFESFYSGKIVSLCDLNQELTIGSEICKIEGI